MKVNMFGRGFKLQLAIIAACQMAFILFGESTTQSCLLEECEIVER